LYLNTQLAISPLINVVSDTQVKLASLNRLFEQSSMVDCSAQIHGGLD